jgi:hypothetical protein
VLSVVFRFVSHIEGEEFKARRRFFRCFLFFKAPMRNSLFSLLPVFDLFFSRLDVFGKDDISGISSMLLHEEETLVSVLGSLGEIVFGEADIVNKLFLKNS